MRPAGAIAFAILTCVFFDPINGLAGEWKEPYFLPPPEGLVKFGPYRPEANIQPVSMNEELDPPQSVAIINYEGPHRPDGRVESGLEATVGARVVRENNQWVLKITKKQDSEKPPTSFYIFITVGSVSKIVAFQTTNIDDNWPIIIQYDNPCKILENTVNKTECLFEIREADGGISSMVYEIKGSGRENEIFSLKLQSMGSIYSEKQWLYLNEPLDYEKTPSYTFYLSATEPSGHSTRVKVFVEVIDVPE